DAPTTNAVARRVSPAAHNRKSRTAGVLFMEFFHHLYQMLRHLNPDTVSDFANFVGPWLYVVLFAIVFCETGLVVTPFLPGDSLLFTIGAVAALHGAHM